MDLSRTVISQTQYKIVYLISFIQHFSFTFYDKFDETCQFFPCKKSLLRKKARFFPNFLGNCAFYGLGTEPEPEPEPNITVIRSLEIFIEYGTRADMYSQKRCFVLLCVN